MTVEGPVTAAQLLERRARSAVSRGHVAQRWGMLVVLGNLSGWVIRGASDGTDDVSHHNPRGGMRPAPVGAPRHGGARGCGVREVSGGGTVGGAAAIRGLSATLLIQSGLHLTATEVTSIVVGHTASLAHGGSVGATVLPVLPPGQLLLW